MDTRAIYIGVGARIAELRAHKRITQEALAGALVPPLSRAALGNTERGAHRITLHHLVQVAALLDTTVSYLLCGTREARETLEIARSALAQALDALDARLAMPSARKINK